MPTKTKPARRRGAAKITKGTTERPQKIYPDPNRGTPTPVEGRCAHPLSNGNYCAKYPLAGVRNCKAHGGKLQQQSYKHGAYAAHRPPHIERRIDEALKDPQLLDMRRQVAIMSVLLDEVWRAITMRIEEEEATAATDRERELIRILRNDEIGRVMTLSEKVSAVIERTARVGLAVRLMVSLDAMNELIGAFVEIASNYITDDKQREKFVAELRYKADRIVDNDEATFNDLMKRRPQLSASPDEVQPTAPATT
jgi:hypothetical protein